MEVCEVDSNVSRRFSTFRAGNGRTFTPFTTSGGVKPGRPTDRNTRLKYMGWKTKEAFEQVRRLQGLPDDFELPNFTVSGAIKAVGNGVPLPLGHAIAKAVWEAMSSEVES